MLQQPLHTHNLWKAGIYCVVYIHAILMNFCSKCNFSRLDHWHWL